MLTKISSRRNQLTDVNPSPQIIHEEKYIASAKSLAEDVPKSDSEQDNLSVEVDNNDQVIINVSTHDPHQMATQHPVVYTTGESDGNNFRSQMHSQSQDKSERMKKRSKGKKKKKK